MNFQSIAPFVNYLAGLLLLVLVLYIKTFMSEKAKNRALIKDISEITNEKEYVIAKYKKEIEEIKKVHDLDIAKRRYQYESKREAYNKFLIFLDNYNSKVGEEMTAKFFPITEKFMKDYLNASNTSKKNVIISGYFNKTIEYSREAYSEYNKLKQETNAIKLSASPPVLNSLEELENFTKESLNDSEEMMKRMPVLITANDKDFIKEYQEYIKTLGEKIAISKKYLIEFMRLDLETI